jgi:hypothetical protein
MNSYNLTNLDIAAKKALEEILRPSALKIVEPWLAQATSKQKKQILFVQGINRMSFHDIKATGPNAYGKAAILAEKKHSVDSAQNTFYVRRSNSEVLNLPQRQARDHFRDYEPVQTSTATQRYYICEMDGPSAQPFAALLKPKTNSQLDQWQVFGNVALQLKADVCAVLRTLDLQYSSMPTYASLSATLPSMERGPLLYQYSQRHTNAAAKKAELLQTKLDSLHRTVSEPTLHEKQFYKEVAQIEVPGGDIIELMDEPRIQYKKAQKAASVCKINFAGGSAEQTTTYRRNFTNPGSMVTLGVGSRKVDQSDPMLATFS